MTAAKILIVEDESIIAMTIEQALTGLGFDIAGIASTGEKAIELAEKRWPDLILMDIRLAGEMDGIEAAGQIRARFGLPIIFLTSHSDDAILKRARVTEPHGYILKPFEERELHIAIEMALYKHRAETQIRQLEKMESYGQLAGGIAHNFNNLLTVIQGYAGMIKDRSAADARTLAFVEQVQAATDRAATLTRQLLTFSQRQAIELRPSDLDRVIKGTLEILRRILPPDVLVEFESPGAVRVEADESMIEQLIVSLAVNARDAMPDGGRLVVEAREIEITPRDLERRREASAGRFARLSVSDTGCGMNAETLSRIFEPFFTTKDVGSGTGLGLSTAHGIVKQHKGWIEVTSEVGAGTRFDIFLPVSASTETLEPAPPASMGSRRAETILLVDDEAALRKMVRLNLEMAGYRVIEAATGRQALEVWKQHADEINLVLTDVQMSGGVSGCDLAVQLLREAPQLRIILSSGFISRPGERELAVRIGGAFLQKPYRQAQLLQAVREMLDR